MNHSNKSTMAAVLCIQIRITKSVVKAPQQDLLWTWWHWGFCVGPPLGPLHPLPEPPNQDVKHESHVSSSRSRNVYYNYSYTIKLNYGDSENAILHWGDVLLPTGDALEHMLQWCCKWCFAILHCEDQHQYGQDISTRCRATLAVVLPSLWCYHHNSFHHAGT